MNPGFKTGRLGGESFCCGGSKRERCSVTAWLLVYILSLTRTSYFVSILYLCMGVHHLCVAFTFDLSARPHKYTLDFLYSIYVSAVIPRAVLKAIYLVKIYVPNTEKKSLCTTDLYLVCVQVSVRDFCAHAQLPSSSPLMLAVSPEHREINIK